MQQFRLLVNPTNIHRMLYVFLELYKILKPTEGTNEYNYPAWM